RLGRFEQGGIRRSLQGRRPRGRHSDGELDEGTRLLLPSRWNSKVLRRSQEAKRQREDGRTPSLSAKTLCLVREASYLDSHRFRGAGRLRLPNTAPTGRSREQRTNPLSDLRPVRGPVGRACICLFEEGG